MEHCSHSSLVVGDWLCDFCYAGVLVVLGLGTAVRLVLEYMHEKNMRRRIALLELDPVPEDPAEGTDSSSDHAATPTPPPQVLIQTILSYKRNLMSINIVEEWDQWTCKSYNSFLLIGIRTWNLDQVFTFWKIKIVSCSIPITLWSICFKNTCFFFSSSSKNWNFEWIYLKLCTMGFD